MRALANARLVCTFIGSRDYFVHETGGGFLFPSGQAPPLPQLPKPLRRLWAFLLAALSVVWSCFCASCTVVARHASAESSVACVSAAATSSKVTMKAASKAHYV